MLNNGFLTLFFTVIPESLLQLSRLASYYEFCSNHKISRMIHYILLHYIYAVTPAPPSSTSSSCLSSSSLVSNDYLFHHASELHENSSISLIWNYCHKNSSAILHHQKAISASDVDLTQHAVKTRCSSWVEKR